MENPLAISLDANTLELHYWFGDETHSMNAVVQNKCEFELLGVLKEIAKALEAEIVIETEPLANGGLKRIFKVITKSETRTAVITTAIIISLTTTIIVTPITTALTKITEKVIDKIFEDPKIKQLDKDLKELEKEKLQEEIKKLKTDTAYKSQTLNHNTVVVKRRSNFYETLEHYPKVDKISFVAEDENKNRVSEETFVARTNFKEYVLVSDMLDPIPVDNAVIDIISPVLKKGSYKWRGIYEGQIISFNMKSNEFKALVQTGKIEFKNGSAINCLLEIQKRINNEGVTEIVDYNIIRVNTYFEHDKVVETPEGKQHRQKQEADKNQLRIGFNTDDDSNK